MMRKILLLSLCMIAFASVNAQVVESNVLHRHCGKYTIGETVMNQTEYASFLYHNCQPAYQEFLSGQKLSQAGWASFGCGLGLTSFGAVLSVLSNNIKAKGGSGEMLSTSGVSFLIAGTCATWLVGIPALSIGYHRMHNSVNTYNVMQKKDVQAYWSLQTSNNGLGVAYNF